MSDSNGPVRRRRIAGESKPAAPAKKAAARKLAPRSTARKVQAKAEPATIPPQKAPRTRTKKAGPQKTAVSKTAAKTPAAKTPAAKTPAVKTPAVKTPAAKVAARTSAPPTPVVRRPSRPIPAASPEVEPASRPSWRVMLALLVAVAVLVAGAVYAFQGIKDARSGGNDRASVQGDAAAAAGSAAETIFSFRYDELDDHLKTSKALMTPKFRKAFDKVAPSLTNLAPQRKIVVEAVTREAAALGCGDECSDSKVNVLVFVDQARLIGDSKQPTVFGNRIKISMVDRDGTWLVDDIRAL